MLKEPAEQLSHDDVSEHCGPTEYRSSFFADERMRDHFMPEDALRRVHLALSECFSDLAFDPKRTARERLHYTKLAKVQDELSVRDLFPLGERDPWDAKAKFPLVEVIIRVRWPGAKRTKRPSKARRSTNPAKKAKSSK